LFNLLIRPPIPAYFTDGRVQPSGPVSALLLLPIFGFCNSYAGRQKIPAKKQSASFILETGTHMHLAGKQGVTSGKCQNQKIG
jgi:hypothetical protein